MQIGGAGFYKEIKGIKQEKYICQESLYIL